MGYGMYGYGLPFHGGLYGGLYGYGVMPYGFGGLWGVPALHMKAY